MSIFVSTVKEIIDDSEFITLVLLSGAMVHLPDHSKEKGTHSIVVTKKRTNCACDLAIDLFATEYTVQDKQENL